MGVQKLVRGEIKEEEDEQDYFLRMFEYVSGRVPLPVFVSLRNGVIHTDALKNACEKKIPVICFKKEPRDVSVLTLDSANYLTAVKHKIERDVPWKIDDVCEQTYDTERCIKDAIEDEISQLDDIPYEVENVAGMISTFLIAVYMNTIDAEKNIIFGKNSRIYPSALSMYLLKEGKWKIPKPFIKGSFNEQSIEYIFEEKMTNDLKNRLWGDLEEKTKLAFEKPVWENNETEGKDSELFGLIFYALLKKRCYDGAEQLMETGYVRIPHLLIGSVILQEAADDWSTSQLQKERILQMKKMYTQQALRITSCIHEADTKYKRTAKSVNDSGQRIHHAGRLLLNQGYLSKAIKTENNEYLNDEIVKKVIKQMWYKHDHLSFKKGMLFFILALLHCLLLLPLMITMERKPLQWLYRQYQVPTMKVILNGFSWLMILMAMTYMLLFDFTERISRTDFFIIAWMTSFFLAEIKQIIISLKRNKIRCYLQDWWNRIDWMTMVLYLLGMLLKLGNGEPYYDSSKICLVLTFTLMCVRFLTLLAISDIIGAKLVMIKKMFLDTFAFLAIMTVIVICYSVSYYAILYSGNSELSFKEIERIIRNGFWILFGELSIEDDILEEPDCTFNKTIYSDGKVPRCPSKLGISLGPYMKAAYALLAIILLLNLLIAMYSHTFEQVHEKSKFHWALLQADYLEEYTLKSIFPIHFQLLVLFACLVHWIFLRSKSNHENDDCKQDPMFFRVFWYDANFDLNLDATRDAEGHAALKASRYR